MISTILQMKKQRHREKNNFPKTTQLKIGRAGIWTQAAILAVECIFSMPCSRGLSETEEMTGRWTDVRRGWEGKHPYGVSHVHQALHSLLVFHTTGNPPIYKQRNVAQKVEMTWESHTVARLKQNCLPPTPSVFTILQAPLGGQEG